MAANELEIIPAILPQDFAELVDKVEQVKALVNMVQVDICDGHFVPSFTWPYKKHDENYDKIVKEEEGMPGWESLDYEYDLMINAPDQVIEDWISAGASRIILHAECKGNLEKALTELKGRVEVGLALNIETSLDVIEKYKDKINFVQLMGIDKIGFQSQPFDEKVLERIKAVKAKYPDMTVSIDGGVSLETATRLREAGADRLVAGSAIFNSDNVVDAIHKLRAA